MEIQKIEANKLQSIVDFGIPNSRLFDTNKNNYLAHNFSIVYFSNLTDIKPGCNIAVKKFLESVRNERKI